MHNSCPYDHKVTLYTMSWFVVSIFVGFWICFKCFEWINFLSNHCLPHTPLLQRVFSLWSTRTGSILRDFRVLSHHSFTQLTRKQRWGYQGVLAAIKAHQRGAKMRHILSIKWLEAKKPDVFHDFHDPPWKKKTARPKRERKQVFHSKKRKQQVTWHTPNTGIRRCLVEKPDDSSDH